MPHASHMSVSGTAKFWERISADGVGRSIKELTRSHLVSVMKRCELPMGRKRLSEVLSIYCLLGHADWIESHVSSLPRVVK